MVAINGVAIHELGCSNESAGKSIPCFQCGFDFVPDVPIVNVNLRRYAICPDCVSESEEA